MEFEHFLWPHQNPLILQRDSNFDISKNADTLGFDELLDVMTNEIEEYFADSERTDPYLALIQGEVGSGKTAFMRHLFEKLKECDQFADYLEVDSNKERLPIFASMINPESRLHFLSAWRPIFTMLIKYFCKREKVNKHHFIANFIRKEGVPELAELIMEITGVELKWMKRK